MTLLLRSIKNTRWIKDERAEEMLSLEDIPSDSLADLNTSACRLSVWKIEPDLSNLQMVATAIASTRSKIDHFSYCLIDINTLQTLKISSENILGDTDYIEANVYHLDLTELSGKKLIDLGREFYTSGTIRTILKKAMTELLKKAFDERKLPEDKKIKLLKPT